MKEAEILQEEEFKQGIEHVKEKQLTENALDNIKDFYQKNQSMCEKANKYYSETDKNINQFVIISCYLLRHLFCRHQTTNFHFFS